MFSTRVECSRATQLKGASKRAAGEASRYRLAALDVAVVERAGGELDHGIGGHRGRERDTRR